MWLNQNTPLKTEEKPARILCHQYIYILFLFGCSLTFKYMRYPENQKWPERHANCLTDLKQWR